MTIEHATDTLSPTTPSANKSIGFIGLGIMGRGMAASLLRSGFNVIVHNRSRAAETPLVEAGASAASSPEELGSKTPVVMLCLSDTAAVEAVLFGPRGLAKSMKAGGYIIDTSTIAANATREHAIRLAKQGITLVDSPISGGQAAAEKGELTCMVGAKAEALAHCLPFLHAISARVVHVGENGAGQIAKACNQIAVSSVMMGIVEAFALARASGVDPAVVREALLGGTARSTILERNAVRLLEQDFKPGFKAALMRKDLRLAQEAAQSVGASEMPVAKAILSQLNVLCEGGNGELDWSAIGKLATD